MISYDIKIEGGKHRHGYIKGKIDDYSWYALIHKEEIEHGINPADLQTGFGKIARLCIYKEVAETGGNPYLPTSSIRRYVYANYKREWDVLTASHIEMVKQLVEYLDRRYSLKVVRCQAGSTEN